jgi:AraC family transcriptional regulator
MHGHELASMCLVLEGRFTEHHAAGEFTCAPRSVLFYPPGFSHREQFDAPRSRCFVVELPHAWIARTAEGPVWGRSGIQVTGGPLADIAVRMHHEMRAFDRASPLVLEGLMLEFLGLATRYGGRSREQHSERLARVRDELHARFREDLSLTLLAQAAGLSPSMLARQFRSRYGCTMGTYVRRLRVQYAARQLAETRASLSQVAIDAGFCDQSHLCRVFLQVTGTSPGAFRLQGSGFHEPRTQNPER